MKNEMLEAALEYQKRGWFVLPLKPGKKEPHYDYAPHGHLSSTDDPKTLMYWFLNAPKANVGVVANLSGLVIIDVDFRSGGSSDDEMFNETYTVKTPDGFHLYYKAQKGVSYKGSYNGCDIKFRGYVAAPPSIHPSGKQYKLINDIEPQPMSADLLREVTK